MAAVKRILVRASRISPGDQYFERANKRNAMGGKQIVVYQNLDHVFVKYYIEPQG
jgi:hypothetical protein